MVENPTIFLVSSKIGETVKDTSMMLPSFFTLWVSKCSIFSPRLYFSNISLCSSFLKGAKMLMDFPNTSLEEYPNIFSAPLFQYIMMPSIDLLIMASSED